MIFKIVHLAIRQIRDDLDMGLRGSVANVRSDEGDLAVAAPAECDDLVMRVVARV